MKYKDDFNVFVGGKTGVFKGLKLKQKSCVKKNIQNLVSITDDHEITHMSWGDDDEKEILVACGSKGIRSVKSYDTENHTFKTSFICDIGEGIINGISKYQGGILTSFQSGHIKLWKQHEEDEFILNAGENLLRMRQANLKKNIIATGGQENPLKLFDLEKKVNIFTAKNVPHNWLQLRVPVSVTDLCFSSNNEQIITVGKFGHIRMYDPKTQRRPVINIEMKNEHDKALTTICSTTQDRQVICGTGRGRMNLVDLRKSKGILNTYKGAVGAVTCVAVSKVDPCIVSTSLDRYLYVHDLNSKKLLKKEYLTSKLTSMVMRSGFSIKEQEESDEEEDKIVYCSEGDFSDSESEDS